VSVHVTPEVSLSHVIVPTPGAGPRSRWSAERTGVLFPFPLG